VSVNEAYRTLRDELARAELLFVRHGGSVSEDTKRTADPTLLMEIMELREELATTRASKDAATRERLAAVVRDKQREATDALRALFSGMTTGTRAQLDDAGSALSRLRYYRRFLDEVAALEDEASL
jgi:molecular chaperone HscB